MLAGYAMTPTPEHMKAARECDDCPPLGYPTDKTRCISCPRRVSAEELYKAERDYLRQGIEDIYVDGHGPDETAEFDAAVAGAWRPISEAPINTWHQLWNEDAGGWIGYWPANYSPDEPLPTMYRPYAPPRAAGEDA